MGVMVEVAMLGLQSQPQPAAKIFSLNAHPIATATNTRLELSGLTYDTTGQMADTANSHLIAPRTGIYLVSGQMRFASSANAGTRYMSLWRNDITGDRVAQSNAAVVGFGNNLSCSATIRMCKGDFIGMWLWQGTGVSLSTAIDYPGIPGMAMCWVGPA